ncbi:iron-regulated transporter [Ceratobasidium sp. AG-Ba]|nr:iron-regulated transporter [Ceratobasidium sp. AG-Ba]
MTPETRRLMLAVVTMSGCGLKLATVGMNVCVERDWVMAIAAGSASNNAQRPPSASASTRDPDLEHTDRVLLRLNTTLRRIDLICKLVAPLFVSLLTTTVGYRLSAAVLLAIGLMSAVFEAIFVGIVYAKFPALALPRPRPRYHPNTETSGRRAQPTEFVRYARVWIAQQAKDWNEFIRHPIFLSSVSISLLYFNVLSFNSPMISYLKSETNLSDPLIAGMRGLCVVTGLFGTFLMPWMEKRIGLIRTGSWAIWSEAITLVPTVLCLYVGVDERDRPAWNSALLFTGMALSRIGLWSFDLAQLTQLQKALAHHPRQNTLSALQFSLQNVFDLAHYGLTLGWNRPAEFKYASAVSIGAVFVAAMLYTVGYARPLRGHLFHFEKLRSWTLVRSPPRSTVGS